MDILDLAKQSGMTVVLDAKIGRQEYRTVHGSVAALECFARLVAASLQREVAEQD
jgi:predicted kinase